jgi:tetratricopeptide (TPR) repeat protein
MTSFQVLLAPAIDRLRRGDVQGARAVAEEALAKAPADTALLEFLGLMATRTGDPSSAIPYFRRWLEVAPGDRTARLNLATALTAAGELEEAAKLVSDPRGDLRFLRLAGYVFQQLGRLDEAAAAYEAVVATHPDDFETWNNLGNVRAAQGNPDAAIIALGRAVALRPDVVPMAMNLSEILARADRPQARQALMRDAAARAPDNAEVMTELGLAEAGARDHAAAERAFREAIRLNPQALAAYVELGVLLENLNRLDDLDALVSAAEANGVTAVEVDFLKAWNLRRQGRFEEALPLAEATPASINPIRRTQLIAEVNDRVGNTARAFAAYAEMNAASLAASQALAGPSYRDLVEAGTTRLTPEHVARWTKVAVDLCPPAPAFILGFPRSGTTLLDTLLMNMPQLHVLEEQPVLFEVEAWLGDEARLATLTSEEANALRRRYFEALADIQPAPEGTTVVDKFPLHMAKIPLIHRLFPDARLIFVERHPCDAVLSCFMSNFQLNLGMRSFTDLEEAARTYAAVFENWTRATALLPVAVHRIRYERMVEDLEVEMRPLLDFLGLPWDPRVLDNRASAAKREHIRTASYAQVTEPIYRRSSGRWQRYRAQLEPVLPILAPWAERMGYDI